MIMRITGSATSFLTILILTGLMTSSCDRRPTAGFRYEPLVNPEAGDTIYMFNESIDATSYEWSFGNGDISEDEMPSTVYDKKGDYTIVLNALNDYGNDTISKIIEIEDPTIMGFYIYEPDSTTPLVSANIWVYVDSTSWDEFEEPDFFELTDNEGYAEFRNLEDSTYYVWIFKETADGLFISGGFTEPLSLNDENLFGVVTSYFSNDELDAVSGNDAILKSKITSVPVKKYLILKK
ncbi:MAG: hypothetical protein K9J30_15150 [Bacteroidales bacterium]|nr:hypothetical protein [Bacteroidales bacterium]